MEIIEATVSGKVPVEEGREVFEVWYFEPAADDWICHYEDFRSLDEADVAADQYEIYRIVHFILGGLCEKLVGNGHPLSS